MHQKNTLDSSLSFLCLITFPVFQDEKAQLLTTYIWLGFVSTAVINLKFFNCDYLNFHISSEPQTDTRFVVLGVEERVCELGPSPVWHQ